MTRAAALLLLGAAILPIAPAAAGDGAIEWRTIETRHFRVNYPVGLEAVAHRAARLGEEAWVVIGDLYGYTPSVRLEMSVTDFGDSANGSATAVPYPRISLLAAPPSLDGNLADYDDWLRLLIFHEFVHIVQLDRMSGLPAWISAIIGRQLAPNQALPSFILEGGAVWAESATSGRGRIHSAIFRGTLRAQALAGQLYGADVMTHLPYEWPGANVWYMYGGHFFDWLARRHGPDGAGRLHDAIGDDLIPFGVNRAAVEAWGRPLADLIAHWQAELTSTAEAEAEALSAAGLTALHPVTTNGQRHGDLRFHPDGHLWSLDGGNQETGVYRRSPAALAGPSDPPAERMLDFESVGNYDLCRGGEAIVYDRADRFRGTYSRYDLWHYDRRTATERRLTRGGRIREPGCAPNGRWAAAIQIVAGRTRLVRVDFADGRISVLYDPGDLDQVAFPRVAPDGDSVVAVRVSQKAGRDLIAVPARPAASALDDARAERAVLGDLGLAPGAPDTAPARGDADVRTVGVTGDRALELQPAFSHDGRWLLYASDRSGVWDIYALRWPDGATHRATRTLTGALNPALSPDGRTLAMQLVTAGGRDIVTAPFAPDLPLPPPRDPPAAERPIPSADPLPLPDRPYSATDTLWPVGWSPAFSFSSAEESASALGLEVVGSDPLGHHAFVASLRTTPETDNIAVSAGYALRRYTATLDVSLSHQTRARNNGAFYGLEYTDFRERVTSGSVGLSLPLSAETRGASVGLRYSYSHSTPAENPQVEFDPLDYGPRFPTGPEQNGSLSLSVSYGDADIWHHDAVSVESGRSANITLRVRHPWLLSDYTTADVTWSYREYLPLWWRHVIALRLSGGFGRGDTGRRIVFGLGAPPERSWFLDALDGIAYGSTFLRGYPAGTARGDRYILGTAEYRMPLFDVSRGLATLPLFLRRLKVAAFTDWAQATSQPLGWTRDDFLSSVGAELVSEAIIGWKQPFSLRLGYAWGLDDGGEGQMYFFLGGWY